MGLLLFVVVTLAAQETDPYCLVQEGDAYRLTNDFQTARDRYLAALSYYERENDAYWQSYIHVWLSEMSYYSNDYERGLQEARRARHIAEDQLNLDTLDFYWLILQNLGVFYSTQKKYDKQMLHSQLAFDAAIKTHGWYSIQAAEAYMSIGVANGMREQWTNCILYLDTSLYISNRLKYRDGLSTGLINISYAYAKKGDLTRAIRTQKQALEFADSEAARARSLNNLGTFYMDVDDYPKAMECLQEALLIRQEIDGRQPSSYFSTRLNIIHTKFEQGLQEEASAALDELIAEFELVEEPPLKMKQIALNYKSRILLNTVSAEAALSCIEEAESVDSKDLEATVSTFFVKSQILYEAGRYPLALRAVQQGLATLSPGRSALEAGGRVDWGALGSIEHRRSLLVQKGAILRAQAEAAGQPALLKASLASLQLADTLVTVSRLSYSSRSSKEISMADARPLYDEMLHTLYALYQLKRDTAYVAQAFHYMEKNRAQAVLENLNKIHARSFHDIPAQVIEQELGIREEIDHKQTDLRYTKDSAAVEQIESRLYELRQQQDSLRSYIQTHYPRYYQTRLQLSVSDLETARSRLLYEGESLVEYYRAGEIVYALVAHRGKVHLEKILAPRLAEQCEALRAAIKQQSPTAELGQDLYRLLLAPIRDHISGKKLLLIPDGPLHYIPFESLVVDISTQGQPRYLLESHSLRQLLSASAALQLQALRGPASSGRILALAPDFREVQSVNRSGNEMSPLPGAQSELDSLEQAYKGDYLRGNEATEAAVKESGSHRGVLHLATHAEIDDQLPTASRLLLEKSAGQDGFLHAYELYHIALSVELAFLSACNTGYGKITAGEGNVSLAHAFAYAGCPNLVMTLWPVRDRTSPTLVSAYYRYLSQGYDKAEALRQAKLFFLKFEPLNAHPYYWSGFTYLGDREPIALQPTGYLRNHYSLVGGALILLLLIIFTAVVLTRSVHS